jgi:hypothetical protein
VTRLDTVTKSRSAECAQRGPLSQKLEAEEQAATAPLEQARVDVKAEAAPQAAALGISSVSSRPGPWLRSACSRPVHQLRAGLTGEASTRPARSLHASRLATSFRLSVLPRPHREFAFVFRLNVVVRRTLARLRLGRSSARSGPRAYNKGRPYHPRCARPSLP